MLKASGLRCEYRENPIGIGAEKPRFSWLVESDGTNILQTAWQLQVARDAGFRDICWDSGLVEDDRSVGVEYAGSPLTGCACYFWRVQIRDNTGGSSGWSDTASFETAIFDPADWQARFISAETPEDGPNSAGKLLRRGFRVEKKVRSARLYATAKGIYEAYINGQRVGDWLLTPGWTEYQSRLLYQSYDVTALLREGENAIGAMVGAGWYKGCLAGWLGRRNIYGKNAKLLGQLLICYEDGSQEVVATDGSWKTCAGPVVYSEIYHGETYDARKEQPGWSAGGFDDSGWTPAHLEADSLDILTAQDGLPIRRQEVLKPTQKFCTPAGETVFDFGQNMTGWIRLSVKGAAGEKVRYSHAEVLDAAGNFYTENLRSAKEQIEYICKGGGQEIFEPHFSFQGFRYIRIDEFPGEPEMENFEAVVVHSDMRPTGSFHCSNELVNQLEHNIRWGMKGNFVDVPTDCPQRDERLGWTGDAQVFIRAASYLMETAPFFEKWLADLAQGQFDHGGVPHVIPDVLNGVSQQDEKITSEHSSCAWADAAVICPWTVYKYFNDKRILEKQYGSMKAWVEYIRAHAQDGLLWNTGFHFADWVALDAKEGSYFGATPNDLVATAYYAYSTQLLAKAAQALGNQGDAQEYTQLHREIVKAFQEEFFTANGRLAARTQTGHVLALWFGLTPEKDIPRTVAELAKLLEENEGHLTTGFVGTPYLCHALTEYGRNDLAYDLILKTDCPSWLYPITKGATTIWEHWDGLKPDGSMWSADMNSFNHYAYGAVGDWLYSVMAGLDTCECAPGYKHAVIHPRPGGDITSAGASYASVYGKVAVDWKLEGGRMTVEVTVPHNTAATVILPGAGAGELSGVRFEAVKDGAQAKLGSGTYTFSYAMETK